MSSLRHRHDPFVVTTFLSSRKQGKGRQGKAKTLPYPRQPTEAKPVPDQANPLPNKVNLQPSQSQVNPTQPSPTRANQIGGDSLTDRPTERTYRSNNQSTDHPTNKPPNRPIDPPNLFEQLDDVSRVQRRRPRSPHRPPDPVLVTVALRLHQPTEGSSSVYVALGVGARLGMGGEGR